MFQSSFELTGYITIILLLLVIGVPFQSSFELTGYITGIPDDGATIDATVSKLFRAYGLYNVNYCHELMEDSFDRFKALSSLRVI